MTILFLIDILIVYYLISIFRGDYLKSKRWTIYDFYSEYTSEQFSSFMAKFCVAAECLTYSIVSLALVGTVYFIIWINLFILSIK